jgi:O-antigen ligase
LGLVCWFVYRAQVSRRAKASLVVLAVALAASQSREAVAAVTVSVVLIWVLSRVHLRRIILVVILIGISSAGIVAARPSNWVEWQRRLTGVVDAFRVPSGSEGDVLPTPTASPGPGVTPVPPSSSAVPAREIRVLYYQQGVRLWADSPLVGYGVGQFGGIVAQENNPNWHLNPRFGPEGFDRHGFKSVQVDSFWLHLLVETGTIGFVAYLVWLFMLIRPLLQRIRRYRGPRPEDPDGGEAAPSPPPAETPPDPARPFALWAIVALAFAAQVAFLSASLEDPLLPALLFTIMGIAWAVSSDRMPPLPVSTVGEETDGGRAKVIAS